jgi:signal transduction histidine kinase
LGAVALFREQNVTQESEKEDQSLHGGRHHAGPILAIRPDGRVSKANLQARRIFSHDRPLSDENLGVVLAQRMLGDAAFPQQLVLRIPGHDGEQHDVLLVISDQDEVTEPEVASPEPHQQEVAITTAPEGGVADFIAHELRNHLAVTEGLTQLLETNLEATPPHQARSVLRSILTETESSLLILEGLLMAVQARRRAVSISQVPVHSVLRRIIAHHKRRFPEREFTVLGDSPVFALGNSTWIQIALANLVNNAEKVTPHGQPIEVSLHREGDKVIVMVLDQGRPLAPTAYEHLWDIYAKGPPAGLEITGSGIGLSITKELVDSMGGSVWAGPRGHGGSAFSISLHSASEPTPPAGPPPV